MPIKYFLQYALFCTWMEKDFLRLGRISVTPLPYYTVKSASIQFLRCRIPILTFLNLKHSCYPGDHRTAANPYMVWRPKFNVSVFVSCVGTPTDLAHLFCRENLSFHCLQCKRICFPYSEKVCLFLACPGNCLEKKSTTFAFAHLPVPCALAFLE